MRTLTWTWTTACLLFFCGGCSDDDDQNNCNPNPCVHGVCTEGSDTYSCACDQGWQGTDCDEPVAGCGDGVIDAPEVCDGSELDGQTCEGLGLGFTGGTLACNSDCLTVDTSACTTTTTPPVGWTCDAGEYADGVHCDCECGAYDIDCDNAALAVSNCQANETCDASGHCDSSSACSQVAVDAYEDNDTCVLAHDLPVATQGATAITVSDPTLHHTDQTLDTDWYAIQAVEGSEVCMPGLSQCYFVFDIALTPPEVAAHATYEMCVTQSACGGTEVCTTSTEWNATDSRYELSVTWEGTCGASDDTLFYVKIARNGGQESCAPYGLEYQLTYTDEQCP